MPDDPFAGSIQSSQPAPPAGGGGDDPFAGSIQPQNYPVQAATAPQPEYSFSTIGQGLIGGATKGIMQTGETFGGQGYQGQPPIGSEPFQLSDLWHPYAAGTKLAERFGESAPTTAGGFAGAGVGTSIGGPFGGILGGALGAGGMSMVQEIGHNFHNELSATPEDPDGAWARALKSTVASGAFTSAAWAAFPAKLLNGPIKNALFQTFGVQPGLAVGHQATENIIHGHPLLEGAGEAYKEGAASTLPTLAGTSAGRAVGRLLGPADQLAQDVSRKPVGERTAQDLKDIAQDHFKQLDQYGIKYNNTQELQALHDNLEKAVTDAHGDERDQPTLYSAIDDITKPRRGRTTIGFEDIAHVRGRIEGLLADPNGNTRRLAAIAMHGLDDWLENAKNQERAGVDPQQAPQVSDLYKLGRSYWHAGKAMESWDRVQDRVDHSPNPINRLRSEITRIVDNPKVHWQYPKEARQMMEAALDKPNMLVQTLRTISKPFDPHSSTGMLADFFLHHLTGTIGVAAPVIAGMTRHYIQKPLEATKEGVPHFIRHAPEVKSGALGSMPPYKGGPGMMDRTAQQYAPTGPAFSPDQQQPGFKRGGAAMRIARRATQRRRYQEGGSDDDTVPTPPEADEADQAQQARDVAAQRMSRAVGPSPGSDPWGDTTTARQQGLDWLQPVRDLPSQIMQHPENIVGPGEIGMMFPVSGEAARLAGQAIKGGVDPERLFRTTNMWQDAAGNWRQESLGPSRMLQDPTARAYNTTVGKMWDAPHVYKQMPDLADMPLRIVGHPKIDAWGQYHPYETNPDTGSFLQPSIFLNQLRHPGINEEKLPSDEMWATLMHEGQHAIDQPAGTLLQLPSEIGNYRPGKSPPASKLQTQMYMEELQKFPAGQRADPDVQRAARASVDRQIYKRSLHEMMARLAAKREQTFNTMEAYEPGAGYRWAKENMPWTKQGGADVPRSMVIHKGLEPYPKKHGGAADRALKMARRKK